ncbi:ABC transporter ATP-binding protein [Bordetella sp. BOR01]|uniref:ABC transporter ATP-binding protein n=1 Tax=Bordetella sp. BOR01 TaxID=2854779 RepID=UPI001C46738C|nr:ABC transporter ATP-binding protein [Bordetella sp. BOR01]MBV7483870.1 ABC transporter ATP-binding protein [Bordetella sp. BOR01]
MVDVATRRALPITVAGVSKAYGAQQVLDQVDLEVRSGEFLTLLGPSGSGKTTLLMALAGFVQPDAGDLRFGERSMVLEPAHKRGIGMVFQSYALFPHMTVGENIGYPLRLRKHSKPEIRARVAEALELVRLPGVAERRVSQLSGGQRQRVALARAIVFEPAILLMDEPLSALDKQLREQMQREIRQLHDRLGVTTVYVTHDQREALTLSDRVAVMNQGRIEQVAGAFQIYQRPATRFVADFIGESHFLPLQRRDGGFCLAGRPLVLPPDQDVPSGESAWLMLRPENLMVDAAPDLGRNRLEGVVTDSVFQGESSRLYVRLDDGLEVSLRLGPAQIRELGLGQGQRVTLSLHAEDTVLLPREDGDGR